MALGQSIDEYAITGDRRRNRHLPAVDRYAGVEQTHILLGVARGGSTSANTRDPFIWVLEPNDPPIVPEPPVFKEAAGVKGLADRVSKPRGEVGAEPAEIVAVLKPAALPKDTVWKLVENPDYDPSARDPLSPDAGSILAYHPKAAVTALIS